MNDLIHVLKPSDPEWDAWLLRAPHDFYHLAAYHEFAGSVGEGRPEMVTYGTPERFLAWPYLVRDIDAKYSDATSVYGYSGPTGRGLDDDAFRFDAWHNIKNTWVERGLVTVFTRFHPLLGNAATCDGFKGAAATPGGEILNLGRSVSINLYDDRIARRAKYRQSLRQKIKRSEAGGLAVDIDPDRRHYEKFIELYELTMRRNQAPERYRFHQDYFDGLLASLGNKIHLAVAHLDSEITAAMLFTVYNGIAQAHLAGVDPSYSNLSPLKQLIDGIADLARDLGAAWLHIGAGRGGAEDSLYQFKSQFSGTRHSFKTGRWILDAEANAKLCRHIPPNADPIFFPAYRLDAVARAVA
jgi:hypothetical protein